MPGEQLGGKRAAMQYYHDRFEAHYCSLRLIVLKKSNKIGFGNTEVWSRWVRILTHLLRSKQRAGEEKGEQRRFP